MICTLTYEVYTYTLRFTYEWYTHMRCTFTYELYTYTSCFTYELYTNMLCTLTLELYTYTLRFTCVILINTCTHDIWTCMRSCIWLMYECVYNSYMNMHMYTIHIWICICIHIRYVSHVRCISIHVHTTREPVCVHAYDKCMNMYTIHIWICICIQIIYESAYSYNSYMNMHMYTIHIWICIRSNRYIWKRHVNISGSYTCAHFMLSLFVKTKLVLSF